MKAGMMMVLALSLLASGAAAAYDGGRDGGFYERQQERDATLRQREWRISDWMRRAGEEGRLPPWEARPLYRELVYIKHKEQAFRADGRLDWREFAELNADLDRLSERLRSDVWTGGRSNYYRPRYIYPGSTP